MKCPKCGEWSVVSDEQLTGWKPIRCEKGRCTWNGWYNGQEKHGRN